MMEEFSSPVRRNSGPTLPLKDLPLEEPTRLAKADQAAKLANAVQQDGAAQPDGSATTAASAAVQVNSTHLTLPFGLGTVTLPDQKKLVFYAGLAGLALFGVVEWPIAGLLGLGHLLTDDRNNRTLQALGEALDDAI